MAQAMSPARTAPGLKLGWLGGAVLVVLVALTAGLAGYLISDSQLGPAGSDQAMADDLAALTTPYDPAKVAAAYTSDAIVHDMIADETSTGIFAIQWKLGDYAESGFKVVNTSAPTRDGDFVAWFATYELTGTSPKPMLTMVRMRGDQVAEQWVYPAP